MQAKRSSLVLLIILVVVSQCLAVLPGIRPRTYEEGEEIKFLVNKVASSRSLVPYSYYSLPFCLPEAIFDTRENLGEILAGDRLQNSIYHVII